MSIQRVAVGEAHDSSKYFDWHFRNRYLHPDDKDPPCASESVIRKGVPLKSSNGDVTITQEVGISRSLERINQQTSSWSVSVTASFEADLCLAVSAAL